MAGDALCRTRPCARWPAPMRARRALGYATPRANCHPTSVSCVRRWPTPCARVAHRGAHSVRTLCGGGAPMCDVFGRIFDGCFFYI
ncbi:hypothetical protein F511_47473 [Dorcoceras hygrometricum]|uniref:Uncharacterized protein n=1 Tax=Dorcoceras hygrometricum TaxID=472368 RepID=A0A2Z6ZQZ3_9LAMI|nr:hypothetical protein F511_47473 [Dorcoceras hygrometricum]